MDDHKKEEQEKKDLYIKVKDLNTILCCVCEKGTQPEDGTGMFEVPLL